MRRLLIGLSMTVAGAVVGCIALIEIATIWLPPPSLERYQAQSQIIVDSERRPLRAYLSDDGYWRFGTATTDVPKLYLDLLLALEDKRFYQHSGVDLFAAARATMQLILKGRIISGASTISMQVVRLLEGSRNRSIVAKIHQIIGARQLEQRLTKQEILEIYLTLTPFGGNLEGVRAASLAYFGKEPAELGVSEMTLLVAVPQSPELRRPDLRFANASATRKRILQGAIKRGLVGVRDAALVKSLGKPPSRREFIGVAPHVANVVRAKSRNQDVIVTTLDAQLQARVSAVLRNAELFDRQKVAGAAIVVRNSDLAVRAYVSGPDFFAHARAGQLDLVRAIRSPGSALKPFIYGMAFEQLVLHPKTIMTDSEIRYGQYAPNNFSEKYSGDMTAREALIRSINTTAVSVLKAIGPDQFATKLRKVGATLHMDDADMRAGLSLALGGCGISMYDLAMLYTALANGGEARPLRLTPDEPLHPAIRLLSPESTKAVTDALADLPAPDGFHSRNTHDGGRRIAYKTGTSFSFRDAWAVGYDQFHTVAVWLGRPDGAPNLNAIGRTAAAPVLYQIFDLLPRPDSDVAGDIRTKSLHSDLPIRLQRFGADNRSGYLDKPVLTFPHDGAKLKLSRGSSYQAVPFVVSGGAAPFLWLVDDAPIGPESYDRELRWTPEWSGQVKLSVIDRNGSIGSIQFWID